MVKFKDTANLPRRTMLKITDVNLETVTFDDGTSNMKVVLTGNVPETNTEGIKISNTTKKALWANPKATKQEFGIIGTASSLGKFMQQNNIRSEKEFIGKEVPLVLQPGRDKEGNPTEQEFYVLELR